MMLSSPRDDLLTARVFVYRHVGIYSDSVLFGGVLKRALSE
jgi:hypothetical protein